MSKTDKTKGDARANAKASILDNLQSKAKSKTPIKPIVDVQEKFTTGKTVVLLPIDEKTLVNAPGEWNVFEPWTEEEMLANKFSIIENGLFSPIIAKDNGDQTYTILAGHNRTRAYREILKEAKDLGKDTTPFEKIPAFVYPKDTTDQKCLEIVIDTNLKARQEMSKKTRIAATRASIHIMKTQKDLTGRTLAQLIEENDLKKTKVYEDLKIADDVIPKLADFYYNHQLLKRNVLKFAWFTPELQEYIFKTYQDQLTDTKVKQLKKDMTQEDIDKLFLEEQAVKVFSHTIKLETDVKYTELIEEWFQEEDFEKLFLKWRKKKEA